MKLKEIKDSFWSEIKMRFNNPFFGAFLVSWIFFNWEIFSILIFIDEKFVSIEPEILKENSKLLFNTKIEYIKSSENFNRWYLFYYPIFISLGITFLISPLTKWFSIFIKIYTDKVSNYLEKKVPLTEIQANKLKENFIEDRKDSYKRLNEKNEDILSLEQKITEFKDTINEKVAVKVQQKEDRMRKKIKNLEEEISKSEQVSSERYEKIKKLEEINKKLEKDSTQVNIVNYEGKKDFKEAYEEFKNSKFFEFFSYFIDRMEINNNHEILSKNFSPKFLKYLQAKGILKKEANQDVLGDSYPEYYKYTEKGNKFCEYFLDEFDGDISKKQIKYSHPKSSLKIDDEITPEDLPF